MDFIRVHPGQFHYRSAGSLQADLCGLAPYGVVVSHVEECVVPTVEDSDLHTEMENLESDEEDDSRWVLWNKSMS